MTYQARPHVVILGGGFAGLESAFLLRHRLHDRVDISLVSDQPTFLFRPNTIYIPYGADPASLRIPLTEPTERQDMKLHVDRAMDVDPVARRVSLESGGALTYDKLIIATGAAMRPGEVPGLAEHGGTIWMPEDMLALRGRIERIVARGKAGQATRVLFLIPPNNKCSGPLYEMVFMLETHLRRSEARSAIDLVWATSESSYIQSFGPRLHEVVTAEFAERKITGFLDREAAEVTASQVRFSDGLVLDYDELISFPPYVAQVRYGALPSDDRGFIRTRLEDRAVHGVEGVYAPGDAGDFPVKQAFLAFLEADAVAESITAEVLSQPPRAVFDPISMCVMEMFDKATFAQVPLRLTGDPKHPVEVRPGMEAEYKVGVSPLWRLGKKLLGVYLPMRFRAGEPFHAGAAWKMMDIGLNGMSAILAH